MPNNTDSLTNSGGRPRRRGRRLRARAVTAAVAAGALAVTAFGSSMSTPAAASTASCVSAAQAAVKKATAAVKPPSPGPKINVSKAKGKGVWLISPLVNPLTSAVVSGFKAGAKLSGVHGVVFEGDGTTASWVTGVTEATAQHASVVILYGIQEALVASAVKAAIAAHVKIIDAVDGDPHDPLPTGVYAHVSANFTHDGALDADYILAQSHCKANVGIFGASIFQVHVNLENGAKKELARLCPSCKASIQNVDVTTAATAVEPQVANFLRANPDVNYLFPVYDQIVPYTNSAVKQVRPAVKLVSHDGVAAQLDSVRAGNTPQIGDISFPPIEWIGWTLIDTSIRATLGLKPGNTTIPARLVTKANAGASNNALFPAFKNLAGVFGPAWGK